MAVTLTTLARARRKPALLGVSEEVLTDLLESAERWAEGLCDWKFLSAAFVGTYNGNGGDSLILKNVPISAIASISITDESGTVEALTIATDVVYEAATGRVRFGPNNASSYDRWPAGFQNIQISYTAGWALASMPEAIQDAIILKAQCVYAMQGPGLDASLESQQVGEGSKDRVSRETLSAWLEEAENMLSQYRRVEV